MARRVYFGFDFEDVADFRANVVRNHWRTKEHRDAAGFFDASLWERTISEGDLATKRLINRGLQGTSVTCILVGSETYRRPWVRYELLKSYKRGSNILAVHINSIPGKNRLTKPLGPDPLSYVGVGFSDSGLTATLYEQTNGRWERYYDVDGCAAYRIEPIAMKHRGQRYSLSELFPTYDWVAEDGYDNFASWVD
jgi:hypothetical protein